MKASSALGALLFMAFSLSKSEQQACCSNGWAFPQEHSAGKCYKALCPSQENLGISWDEAHEECERDNSTMATVKSRKELEAVREIMGTCKRSFFPNPA